MSHQDNNQEIREIEDERLDEQLDAALKNFRYSIHAWSEQEMVRARTVRRAPLDGFWRVVANPVMAWALAAVLVVSGVGVPVAINHQRQVVQAQRAAAVEQQKMLAAVPADFAVDDEDLLKHVDSDIAQSTPDAMEPLASMMGDGTSK